MSVHVLGVSTTEKQSGLGSAPQPARRQILRYGGQQFNCSAEMAQIFLKHARDVIESGEQQLVPLLHSGGIDLLLVSRLTPYSLISLEGS